MRDFFRRNFDPRHEPFWRILLACGAVFRFWNVLGYRNPMDLMFSDAFRHVDNARHFLEPGPMGASNPYLYQLFLWAALKLSHEGKLAMGLVASGLSILYPFCWYLFASRVVRRRITALRYATVISFLPTHVSMFSFFMNETLLYPLLGAAFWATATAAQRRSRAWFALASTFWVMAVLTRSMVMPIGGLAMLWAWWRQPRKVVSALAAAAIVSFGFGVAAERAYPLLHRYTPFGDNLNVAIYFVSAAHDYTVNYSRRGSYIYASPSLYISPFDPFYEWTSSRKGNITFTLDAEKKGADVQETFRHQLALNRGRLPRMVFENLIFISFSHSWPDAGKGNVPGTICLWERWIWFPIILLSFFGAGFYIRRRGPALVPVLSMLFTLNLYGAQAAIMEGRYRKPLEPFLVLTLFWLAEARKAGRPFKAGVWGNPPPLPLPRGGVPSARVLGIGGVFFKAQDPAALSAWYARHLGVVPGPDGAAAFGWRHDDAPERRGRTVWAPFPKDTTYFEPSQAPFMVSYVVEDLDAALDALRADGVTVDERREEQAHGRFGWVMDPEGNRIELWEPRKKEGS